MRFRRKDKYLDEAIELLDAYYEKAGHDLRTAYSLLDVFSQTFITTEIERCVTDFRYYAENYHCIATESEGIRTLNPFWDSQEIFYDVVLEEQKKTGKVKICVLKARQLGQSTVSEALIFHKTIFTEACNSLVVAQDPDQTDYLFNMSRTAYECLPWWMRPECRYDAKGNYLIFDRKRPEDRVTNPGLRSQILCQASNKATGVGVGKTLRAVHLSEVSLWENPDVLTKHIFPTMNAPDTMGIMESTARGRNNAWHHLWLAAMNGHIDWRPVFIESYRVKKYFIPIPTGEKFELTKQEVEIRDRIKKEKSVEIPDGHFYWRRKKIQESIAINNNPWAFFQEYPSVDWMEAFQGSGITAFNREKMYEILQSRCCDPLFFGEISLSEKMTPVVRLEDTKKADHIPAAEGRGARLLVWEMPEEGEKYFIGADVAMGVEGGDFSCAYVLKIGKRLEPDEFVAEWHGWESPTPYAEILCALGKWYNNCQIAVECNGPGLTTNTHLFRVLQYYNLFRWKHYDKIKNFITDYLGWWTNIKTRDQIIAKFREAVDSGVLIIRSKWLIDEMLDFAEEEGGSRFEGQGNNDDRCFVPGTFVRTERGLIPIREVVVGDNVLSHDGCWYGVDTVGKRFVDEEIVKLKVFGVPDPILCTNEHPILAKVRTQSSPAKFKDVAWVPAEGLKKGDCVFVPVAPLLQPAPLTDEEMYLLGWCLADGSASATRTSLRITFHNDERVCAEVIKGIIEHLVDKHPTAWIAGHGGARFRRSSVFLKDHGGWIDVECTNRWLNRWVRHWTGDPSKKRIHETILNAQGTLPFVVGFLEGDGSQKNTRGALDVSQKDRETLYGIRQILLRHGIWAGIFPKLTRDGQFRMSIGVPWFNKLLSIFRGCLYKPVARILDHPIARWDGNGFWVTLQDVGREHYKGLVHNLSVSVAHSYTAGEIAAHNCFAAMITSFCAHDSDYGKKAALEVRENKLSPEERRKIDFFNTDYSPIHDRPYSLRGVLHAERNMPAEMIMYSDLDGTERNPTGEDVSDDWKCF